MKKKCMLAKFLLRFLGHSGLMLSVLIGGTGFLYAQTRTDDTIVVKGWKTGNGRISEKSFSLDLNEDDEEFEIDIPDDLNTKLYRMTLKKVFTRTFRTPSIQCWSATFNELIKYPVGGYLVWGDLLSIEGPGYGDTMPGSDNIFCPIENPKKPLDGGHRSILQPRKFLVEGFMIEMKVGDYVYDEKAVRLRKFNIAINLKNQTQKK